MTTTDKQPDNELRDTVRQYVVLYNAYKNDDEFIYAIMSLIKQDREQAERLARLKTASDIFNLAHQYAQDDKTMIGSEELRNYHYYNAIHNIGEFND